MQSLQQKQTENNQLVQFKNQFRKQPQRINMQLLHQNPPQIPRGKSLFDIQSNHNNQKRHSQSVFLPDKGQSNHQSLFDIQKINSQDNFQQQNQDLQTEFIDTNKYLYEPNQTNYGKQLQQPSTKVDRSIQYSERQASSIENLNHQTIQQQTPFDILNQKIDEVVKVDQQLQSMQTLNNPQSTLNVNQDFESTEKKLQQYSRSYTIASGLNIIQDQQHQASSVISGNTPTTEKQSRVHFNLQTLQRPTYQQNSSMRQNHQSSINSNKTQHFQPQLTQTLQNQSQPPPSISSSTVKKYDYLSKRLDKMRDLVEDIKYKDYLKRVEILNQKKAYLSTYRFVLKKEEKQILIKEIEEREKAVDLEERDMFIHQQQSQELD
eukprot:403346676